MKFATFFALLMIMCSIASGQNLIGYNNQEIKRFMIENRKDMNANTVRNSLYSYLKYSDNTDSQTILFFLDSDSVCNNIRVICNSVLKPEKIKELDSSYKKTGNNSWIDSREGMNILINFREEKWNCVITFESEN